MPRESHEMISTDYTSRNLKKQLLEYVKKNDIQNICTLLARDCINLLIEKYDYPYCKPILYIACEDLANYVISATIETLIKLGADPHFIDEETGYQEAIHFAVRGMNPDILRVIVMNITKEDGINATTYGNTALHLLVMNDKVNTREFEKCLDILLEFGINVNKLNKKSHTAILLAASQRYKNVVTKILNCGRYVNIDNVKYDGKTARDYIIIKQLYDGVLPLHTVDPNEYKFDVAVTFIQENRVEDFLMLENIDVNGEIEEGTLLQLACERNLIPVVQFLLEHGANVNKVTPKNEQPPLKIVAERGYHKLFKLLLNKYIPLPQDILILLISSMTPSKDEDVNYEECVRYWLKERKPNNNECSTGDNTPLYYASGFSNTDLTLLMEEGVSLGVATQFNSLLVEEINPQMLKQYFNNCISIKEQFRDDKQSIIVTFDYISLIPTVKVQREYDVECDVIYPRELYRNAEKETEVIHAMSKSPELRKLLVHPLISSFILIKWHRMRWFFWTNLLLFALFSTSLIAYVFLPNPNNNGHHETTIVVWCILLLTYILLILREVTQMVLSITRYFCSWTNRLEIFMLGICWYVIFFKSSTILYKQFSSIAMILVALEIMLLFGQHLFFCWYGVLILAFVLSFYKLFNNNNGSNRIYKSNCTDSENEKKRARFL